MPNEQKEKVQNYLYREVSFWLSILGLAFGAFIYLTAPSRDNDTALQLQDQRITSQDKTIADLTKVQQNDTQEVKAAVKDLILQIQIQQQEITKLSTIIDERIPKKKVVLYKRGGRD